MVQIEPCRSSISVNDIASLILKNNNIEEN
jgi:hypothetical protein